MQSRGRRRADESYGKNGVAVLRSSVIRANGKNVSPVNRRRKEGEKKIGGCWMEGGKSRVLYRTTHRNADGLRALNSKVETKPNGMIFAVLLRYSVI